MSIKKIRNLLLTTLLIQASQSGLAATSVSGYVDGQYNWANTKNASGGSTPTTLNTFRLDEAAVYLNHEEDNFRAYIDLAISGVDKTASTGFTTSTSSAALSVGLAKSQAFIHVKESESFQWQIGQFDAIIGYEAPDSWELKYTSEGLIASRMPASHVGALFQYQCTNDITWQLVVSNPYDQGHMKNGNIDIGTKAIFSLGNIGANIGVLMSTGDHNATGLKHEIGFVSDLTLTYAASDSWNAAFFAYAKKEDHIGTRVDMGAGLDLGAKLSDMTGLGLRLEYEKDGTPDSTTANGTLDDSTYQITAGPNFEIAKDTMVKLDYSFVNTNYDKGLNDEKSHRVDAAVVMKF